MPLDAEHKERYYNAAMDIMNALIDECAIAGDDEAEGLLAHGTYYYAGRLGIDECCIWGDYFYLEALMRLVNPEWEKFW